MAQDRPLYRQVSSEDAAEPSPNGKSKDYGEGHFISPLRDTQGLGPQEHSNRRSDDSRPPAGFGFGTDNPMEGKFIYQMTQTSKHHCLACLSGQLGKLEMIDNRMHEFRGEPLHDQGFG